MGDGGRKDAGPGRKAAIGSRCIRGAYCGLAKAARGERPLEQAGEPPRSERSWGDAERPAWTTCLATEGPACLPANGLLGSRNRQSKYPSRFDDPKIGVLGEVLTRARDQPFGVARIT